MPRDCSRTTRLVFILICIVTALSLLAASCNKSAPTSPTSTPAQTTTSPRTTPATVTTTGTTATTPTTTTATTLATTPATTSATTTTTTATTTSPPPPPPTTPVAPTGDYGDAPDGGPTGYPAPFEQTGKFPTLFANNGARTLRVNEATLGASASLEANAIDPADPDGLPNLTDTDSDNALVKLDLTLLSIPPPAKLQVQVAGSAGGAFFLNAVIDLNMDGKWGGKAGGVAPEWAVKNLPVLVPAGSAPTWVAVPMPFLFGNGNLLPDRAWMRLALTKESIATADWDGTGQFSSGEIEDVVVRLPGVGGGGGKSAPILSADVGGPYHFARGEVVKNFTVTVLNSRIGVGGAFTWTMVRIDGGVAVAPLAGGGNILGATPGIGGGPGEAKLLFTATKGLPLPSRWRFTVQTVDPDSFMDKGQVVVGYADPTSWIFEFTSEKAWIAGAFLLGISVLSDPAGHDPFIALARSIVGNVAVVGDPTITITGSGAWVPVSGELKPDGSFVATGKGTVAGFPNVSVRFTGTWTEYDGFSGEYAMGVGGELPGGQPITYKVDAKRQ